MRARHSILVLLVAIALFVSPGPAAAEDDLATLVADLGGTDGTRRSNALRILRERKDARAIPLILEAIEGFDLIGRYYGVLVLESYPTKEGHKALRTLTRSADPYLRLCGGTAVYWSGETRGVGIVTEALLADGVETQARVYMLNKLTALRDQRIRAAVRTFLVAQQEASVVAAAVYVLHIQQDKEAMPACRALLACDSADHKALAAAYLLRFGDASGGPALAEALRAGGVTSTVFSRLKMLIEAAGSVSVEILDAIAALVETETNSSVLSQAISMLGSHRHRKALPVLRKLLEHSNRLVAKAAYQALAQFPGALNVETLHALLASGEGERGLWAAEALRRMDDPAGLPVVIEVLKTGTDTERYEAARILGGFRVAEAVEPLLDALLDSYTSTRSYALSSLTAVLQTLFPYRRLNLASTGYTYTADEAVRRQAVARIRAWWEKHRNADW